MPRSNYHQHSKPSRLKWIFLWGFIAMNVVLVGLFAADYLFVSKARNDIYYKISDVPVHDVGLVLGTSKYIGKVLNPYYTHRIDAAIALYENQKVSHFLLSGDNAHRSYNEPWTMKRDLLKANIPETNIHLDYAGFRTLDSIVRAKKVFKSDNFLIITQKFHCERALYIAHFNEIHASCLAVPGASDNSGIYLRLREVFARVKALLDLYVLDQEPKFLGPEEPILHDAPTEPSQSAEPTQTLPATLDSAS